MQALQRLADLAPDRRHRPLPPVQPPGARPGALPELPLPEGPLEGLRHPEGRGDHRSALPPRPRGPHRRRHDGQEGPLPEGALGFPRRQIRHAPRHADDRQGPRLPARDVGGHHRRRSLVAAAGLPRRRTHLPAPHPGRRPRGPRRPRGRGRRAELPAGLRPDPVRQAPRFPRLRRRRAREARRVRLPAGPAPDPPRLPRPERREGQLRGRRVGQGTRAPASRALRDPRPGPVSVREGPRPAPRAHLVSRRRREVAPRGLAALAREDPRG